MTVTITGLDPAKTYSFATTANRDNSSYTARISRFTISDITSATNASTPGVTVVSNESVAFSTGYNTVNGYVARWTGIQPGSDGDFVITTNAHTTENNAYGPSVFSLSEETSGPTIITTGTLSAFSTTPGVASAAQTYTVSGASLTGNIVITAPAGFELSTNGTTFASSLSLTPTGGTVATTTVYVRLYSTTESPYSGNITHTSTGAASQNVAVSGTVSNTICTTANLAAAEDTYLSANDVTYNNGGNTSIHVDGGTGTGRRTALLNWNVSSIPPEATCLLGQYFAQRHRHINRCVQSVQSAPHLGGRHEQPGSLVHQRQLEHL